MTNRRQIVASLVVLPVLSAFPRQADAMAPEFYTKHGIAVGGADVVAYFRNGQRLQGDPVLSVSWRSATWQFSSVGNRDAFEMNPAAFAPQFGGFCAYAMAQRAIVPADPDVFVIRGGRLFLTFSADVRRLWLANPAHYISLAEANWPLIRRN
jgi:hypothetical protein